jgi:hypothetical protein
MEDQHEIPSRVDAKKDLKISKSQIHDAGRGLFSREDIKAGELIFTVPQPLLNIVHLIIFTLVSCN